MHDPGFFTWRELSGGIPTSARVDAGDLAYLGCAIASTRQSLAWIGLIAALLAGLLRESTTQLSLALHLNHGGLWDPSGCAYSQASGGEESGPVTSMKEVSLYGLAQA